MEKTRHFFNKIRYTKETFLAKMGTIKDRNGKDLIEADEIKKRWQEYSEELYKKGLNNHHGVVTHLEPDILECEVKWVLGSITMNKAGGGDGIPAELFQILKDDILKCCTQYVSKFGKSRSGLRTKKGQFSFQSQRKATKEGSNYHTVSLILNVRKVMFKILQARLQQSVREPRTS